MKLIKAQVTNYRSIEDSNEFEIGDLTCLVGKNEAGKSSLLLALRGVNPFGKFTYDKTNDYPRRFLSKYDERHPDGRSMVAKCWWRLEPKDLEHVVKLFGEKAVTTDVFTTEHGFGYDKWSWNLPINHRACLDHLIQNHKLEDVEKEALKTATDCASAVNILTALPQRSPKLEELLKQLQGYKRGFWDPITGPIDPPEFFYTSHFDRMAGEISLNQLAQDRQQNRVKPGDKIFLDFLEYAGTTVEELQGARKSEELKATLEAASNDITEEIFQFWSQNDALEIKIDIGEGKPEDPPPFNSGTVIKIRIENRNHRATVPLSERSAGFIWFFSFLAQFKQLQKRAGNAVLLLDEPGLTLHGKAQADLLRYIQERLLPQHQVIYTTHSPFMVPADRMADVRIVEDVVERPRTGRPIIRGTKVRSDVLRVDRDTLFPLQGALGYEISQSLFVGKNTLLVEGPSDILYLQIVSAALRKRSREPLDPRWTLCPSGGIDKISPFVSLFGGNNLNITVLCDLASGDKGKIEKLRKSEILKAGRLFTAADFSGKQEGDIEDFFHPALYAEILNQAFGLTGAIALDEAKLLAADPNTERLVKKAEAAFKVMPAGTPEFDHYTPAEWLLRNPGFLDAESVEVAHTLKVFELAIGTINRSLGA
jgi:energy-coupling factor transporter ATP-binding protein EcfA2